MLSSGKEQRAWFARCVPYLALFFFSGRIVMVGHKECWYNCLVRRYYQSEFSSSLPSMSTPTTSSFSAKSSVTLLVASSLASWCFCMLFRVEIGTGARTELFNIFKRVGWVDVESRDFS